MKSFYFRALSILILVAFTSSCVPALSPMGADDEPTIQDIEEEKEKKKDDEETAIIVAGVVGVLLVLALIDSNHRANNNDNSKLSDDETDYAEAWHLARPSASE